MYNLGLTKHQAEFILSAKTKGEAQQRAIDWQAYQSTKASSYLELSIIETAFRQLAAKFNLTEEFKENGII